MRASGPSNLPRGAAVSEHQRPPQLHRLDSPATSSTSSSEDGDDDSTSQGDRYQSLAGTSDLSLFPTPAEATVYSCSSKTTATSSPPSQVGKTNSNTLTSTSNKPRGGTSGGRGVVASPQANALLSPRFGVGSNRHSHQLKREDFEQLQGELLRLKHENQEYARQLKKVPELLGTGVGAVGRNGASTAGAGAVREDEGAIEAEHEVQRLQARAGEKREKTAIGKTKLAVVYKGSSEKEKALEDEVGSLKKQLETMREVYEAGLVSQENEAIKMAQKLVKERAAASDVGAARPAASSTEDPPASAVSAVPATAVALSSADASEWNETTPTATQDAHPPEQAGAPLAKLAGDLQDQFLPKDERSEDQDASRRPPPAAAEESAAAAVVAQEHQYNQQQDELLTARAQIAQMQAELAQVRLESQDRELAQTLRTQTLEGELKREREIKEMQTRQLRRLAGKVAEQEQQKAQPMVTSGSGASDQSQTRQQQQIIQALGEEKAQLQKELQHVHAELEDNFTLKATVRSLEQSGRLLKQQVMKLTKENRKLAVDLDAEDENQNQNRKDGGILATEILEERGRAKTPGGESYLVEMERARMGREDVCSWVAAMKGGGVTVRRSWLHGSRSGSARGFEVGPGGGSGYYSDQGNEKSPDFYDADLLPPVRAGRNTDAGGGGGADEDVGASGPNIPVFSIATPPREASSCSSPELGAELAERMESTRKRFQFELDEAKTACERQKEKDAGVIRDLKAMFEKLQLGQKRGGQPPPPPPQVGRAGEVLLVHTKARARPPPPLSPAESEEIEFENPMRSPENRRSPGGAELQVESENLHLQTSASSTSTSTTAASVSSSTNKPTDYGSNLPFQGINLSAMRARVMGPPGVFLGGNGGAASSLFQKLGRAGSNLAASLAEEDDLRAELVELRRVLAMTTEDNLRLRDVVKMLSDEIRTHENHDDSGTAGSSSRNTSKEPSKEKDDHFSMKATTKGSQNAQKLAVDTAFFHPHPSATREGYCEVVSKVCRVPTKYK